MRVSKNSRMMIRARVVAVVVVLGGLLAAVPPAAAQQVLPCDSGAGSFSRVTPEPRYEILPQEVVTLRSNLDGVRIELALFRPDVPAGTEVPVIVDASVYLHPMRSMDLRECPRGARLIENFVPQGYAVALIAVRGTADSGGCMNLFGPGERADLDQAITWLGTRSWSNGAVGMVGLSYDGSTPWEVAAAGNPYLKTIVPIDGVPDLFDLLHGGGIPDWRGPAILNALYYGESVGFYAPGRSTEATAQVIACPEYVDGTVASITSSITGELDSAGYWAERRFRDDVAANYRGSILLVQGLQDWNVNPGMQFPWVPELAQRPGTGPVHYLLGQWGHTYPDGGRADWADLLLGWFDRWLKGDHSVDLGPVAQVQDSSRLWRSEATWPPLGTEVVWRLSGDGRLTTGDAGAAATRQLVVDPTHTQQANYQNEVPRDLRDLCTGVTCAEFVTEPFASEFRFAGLPRVQLPVTPQGPGGQLSVYLYAETDSGAQRLGWGQVDLRFPNGVPSGTPQARPVVAGEEVLVDVALQPLDVVVPAGARLQMVVSEGTAYNRLPSVPNFPMTLAVGGERTTLTVTEVDPAASQFFEPPD